MRIHRQSLRWWLLRIAAGAFVFPVAALPAQGRDRVAAGRPLFEWKGRVDRELRISMRGREAWIQSSFRTQNGRRDPVVSRALPREDGAVRVRVEAGRGTADVVQQPSRRNDYTAVIRIQDRSNGSDIYRVTAYWLGRDGGYADGGWGRGRNGNDWPNDGGWGRTDRFDRTVLRWSGRVDDGLEIRVHDGRIEYRDLSGKGRQDVRAELSRTGLPRDGSELRVESWTARGDVVIVQQPSARNDYTAVIRIRDPQPSYGFYDFTLTSERRYGTR